MNIFTLAQRLRDALEEGDLTATVPIPRADLVEAVLFLEAAVDAIQVRAAQRILEGLNAKPGDR